MSKIGQFKTMRECACSPSSLLQLSGAPELVTARSNARKADLEAGLLDSHNETNQRSLRLCQSRNGATNSTIAEESFPDDVTQREPAEFPEQRAELTTWHPKQRTELTRENETNFQPALNQQKASNKPKHS